MSVKFLSEIPKFLRWFGAWTTLGQCLMKVFSSYYKTTWIRHPTLTQWLTQWTIIEFQNSPRWIWIFKNFKIFIPLPKYSPSNDLTTIEQLKLGTFEPRKRSKKVTRGENKIFMQVNETCFLTKVPTFSAVINRSLPINNII